MVVNKNHDFDNYLLLKVYEKMPFKRSSVINLIKTDYTQLKIFDFQKQFDVAIFVQKIFEILF